MRDSKLEAASVTAIVGFVTEENFIDFKCPHCSGVVSFPEGDAGYVRACPECMQDLIVPNDGGDAGQSLPLPIETKRLRLRRLARADWKDVMECVPESEEENIIRWLEADSHVRLTTAGSPFCLGLELQDQAKLIGYLTLNFTDVDRLQATFSFNLNPKYEQVELLAEAVDALVSFCIEGIKLHRIAAKCYGNESVLCKALEEVGLRREGEFVKDTRGQDGWLNSIWYALLAEEYFVRPTGSA